MYFGFSVKNGEFIPEIFRSLDSKSKLLSFLLQFNSCVEKELRIPLNYAKTSLLIREMFEKRIGNLLNSSKIFQKSPKKICIASNLIIQNYLKGNFEELNLSNTPKMAVARLIQMVFMKDNPGIFFKSDYLFDNYIFSKILKANHNKNIYIENGCIFIQKNDNIRLGILTCCKKFDFNSKSNLRFEIVKAFELCDKNTEIYLVFPKQNGLKRHIEVRGNEGFYGGKTIKIVPYSILEKKLLKGTI